MIHSVALVTFADLGKRENYKTRDILPIIKTFRDQGYLAQIICRIDSGFDFPDTSAAVPQVAHYILAGMGKIAPAGLNPRWWEERIFDFFASRRLGKADVVFFHPEYSLSSTIAKAKRNGAVTVGIAVTAHGKYNARLEQEEFVRLGLNGVARHRTIYGNLVARGAFQNRCDYIIAMSDFVKDTYVAEGMPAEKIFVAEQDIDMERYHCDRRTSAGKFTVLYVAHTSILKGLHYLLDAWKRLYLPGAELVIVGGYGPISAEVKANYECIIKDDPTIKWVGYTGSPEIYYRDASVFVCPSLTEAGPRVVQEAMASCLAIITTENAKAHVKDGETGFVVPIRDSEAIREKIEFLYRNPEKRKEMGAAARESILSKKSFGKAVFEIYKEILRREHRN